MIAGPILGAKDFLPQIQGLGRATRSDIQAAAFFLSRGLVKKVVVADWLAGYVDTQFSNRSHLGHAEVWLVAWVFAFQIYLDFSGYSDMAKGLGRLFGLRLADNFRTPYLATSPTKFWRRWHVTLSTWFRDYLFIPLGGTRCPVCLWAGCSLGRQMLGRLAPCSEGA